MKEETSKREVEIIEEENAEKVIYTCNSCGREDDTGYFYCEKCHRKHKKPRQERTPEVQLEQEKVVKEA